MSKKKKEQQAKQEEQQLQEEVSAQDELREDDAPTNEATDTNDTETDALKAAHEEIAELKDKLLRQHADMDNLRKRMQREVADAHKYAIEKFAVALLDVVDNLERAVETEEGNEQAVRQGIELTLDSWHKVASKFELERIDAVGQMFDPHLHEALSKMPSDEPEDTVVAQHVAGYTLNGRLIRPAKVLVSSGPAK